MLRMSAATFSMAMLTALALSVCTASGQTATGQVTGTVMDQTGAHVANAEVTLQNLATNIETKVTSNARGAYTFPNVAPGTYSLRIELSGFKSARIPEITVGVNQVIQQDVLLSIGQVTESVEVRAEAELVQRAT